MSVMVCSGKQAEGGRSREEEVTGTLLSVWRNARDE